MSRSIARRRGYTLVEMLTTVAILVIFLGLMVSLARRVRAQSAELVTKEVLVKLDRLMAQYIAHNNKKLPAVQPFLTADQPVPQDEAALRRLATANNKDFVRVLRSQPTLARAFEAFPVRLYDEVTLHDDWGNPIVFMPSKHKDIGTALRDRYFFFSAGSDGKYLTRDDNLYSYEVSGE